MKPTMIAFTAVIAVILVLACMQVFFKWDFNGAAEIVAIVILFVFAAATILGMFGQKFTLRRLGMYALHVGLLLFLLGSFIYSLTGVSIPASLPINASMTYSTIKAENGKVYDLGFEFGIYSFKVETYDPVYDVYEVKGNSQKLIMKDVYVDGNGYYDFKKYGKVHANVILSSTEYNLAEKVVAIKKTPDKYFECSVKISDESRGKSLSTEIWVNHPLRYGGWKIYLMSYSNEPSVSLLFKKDPTEWLSTAGIIVTLLGAVYVCIADSFVEKMIIKRNVKIAKAKKAAAKKKKEQVKTNDGN